MAPGRYCAAGAAQGCELRPPGSFAVCADQAFDAYVSRALRTLVEVVTFNVRQFQPVGVILTGSLARGEGVLAAGADGKVDCDASKLDGWVDGAATTERSATGAWSGVMAMASGALPTEIAFGLAADAGTDSSETVPGPVSFAT